MAIPNNQFNASDAHRAVILLSGGLDSYSASAIAIERGFACYGLTVDYHQRHSKELACAAKIAQALNFDAHKTIELDLRSFCGSALTSTATAVPKGEAVFDSERAIPPTYVPARNTILLSLALGWAESLGAFDIFIGVNAIDYSGYPDCRAEFIAAFEGLANLATAAATGGAGKFEIHAPLIGLTKSQIIKHGARLNLDYSLTHSCYDPDDSGLACGRCDSCLLRRKGFEQAHTADPIKYKGHQ